MELLLISEYLKTLTDEEVLNLTIDEVPFEELEYKLQAD